MPATQSEKTNSVLMPKPVHKLRVNGNDSDCEMDEKTQAPSRSPTISHDSKNEKPVDTHSQDNTFKPMFASSLSKVELADMISQYYNANMPSA